MKTAYLDTNVFVASYKPDDVFHEASTAIAKALGRGEIRGQTSTLTILESAAVASRTIRIRKGDDERDVRRRAVGRAILNLSRLGLKFIHILGDSSTPMDSYKVEMPAIFHQALLLASDVGLKSFDLVHLAAARYSGQMDSNVGAFVTGDRGFLRKKKDLSRIIGMPVLSPKEYVEGLGIGT
ncbi:MAG: type II toxin-antitoxin system VapC family toxin [Thaumarchaeota archaeon]|nr:MAG: type II toxin-antitoxin system VapC family toxin [Nitrososphaerota archaeon]